MIGGLLGNLNKSSTVGKNSLTGNPIMVQHSSNDPSGDRPATGVDNSKGDEEGSSDGIDAMKQSTPGGGDGLQHGKVTEVKAVG